MKDKTYSQKKLLRCPGGCGWPIDFTFGLYPCLDCGKLLCQHCQKLWQGTRYCKKCLNEHLDERSKGEAVVPSAFVAWE